MAISPAHRLGQLIGDFVEEAMTPLLEEFCAGQGLYLDKKGERGPARTGKKVSWTDKYGNSHDLDFVIEKDGTKEMRGQPLAFIEVAWRRYTKHSRNKVQEIQGAVLPIAENHPHDSPFLGAVLAGVFTEPSLEQMRSSGFTLLLFPYEAIVGAFRSEGVEANFDENTENGICRRIVDKIEGMNPGKKEKIRKRLLAAHEKEVSAFLEKLRKSVKRSVSRIMIIPLHGKTDEFKTVGTAKKFIDGYHPKYEEMAFHAFEIIVEFNNGDKITASFKGKREAADFLEYIEK